MSDEDMAPTPVKELPRKAFRFEQGPVEADGDIPTPYGTALRRHREVPRSADVISEGEP